MVCYLYYADNGLTLAELGTFSTPFEDSATTAPTLVTEELLALAVACQLQSARYILVAGFIRGPDATVKVTPLHSDKGFGCLRRVSLALPCRAGRPLGARALGPSTEVPAPVHSTVPV